MAMILAPSLRRALASLAIAGLAFLAVSCTPQPAPLVGSPQEVKVPPNPRPAEEPAPKTGEAPKVPAKEPVEAGKAPTPAKTEVSTLGAGCFWCIEAVLLQMPGVLKVESGYMGGPRPNPTYEEVCTGTTGHAEVVQVTFDPEKLSFAKLLDVFWKLHDPTTLNRQGNDVGTQYRSAIFYHSDAQKETAERSKKEAAKSFPSPIVTEITKAATFYKAENYHQDYYRLNRQAPYCRFVIAPKLEKLGLKK